MRVITGSARGKRIRIPESGVRPMAARVKKSVFDRIGNLEGCRVLDVFAGSGALGIESLSRGAEAAVFVEKSRIVADILSGNIQNCGFERISEVLCLDYRTALKKLEGQTRYFDFIFLCPPYKIYSETSPKTLMREFRELLSPDGKIVIEYESNADPRCEDGAFRKTKKYGGTTVSILEKQ